MKRLIVVGGNEGIDKSASTGRQPNVAREDCEWSSDCAGAIVKKLVLESLFYVDRS